MLKSRRLVAALAGVIILACAFLLRTNPVDVLPEYQPVTVDIQTEALGLSATEVEQLVTVPLEQDLLRGVAWLESVQSESVPGLSSLHLTFDPGTDLYRARELVQERIQTADLANVSKPPQMLQPTSSSGRVMMIGLSTKTMSLINMSVLAKWTIVPKLMGVPGVANVAIWGQRDEQLQVMVDPTKLAEKNVSVDDIITTTGDALWYSPLSYIQAAVPGTGGFVETPNQRLTIMHLLPITSPAQLAQVPVENTQGQTLTPSTTATTEAGGGTTPSTGQGNGTTGSSGGTTTTTIPRTLGGGDNPSASISTPTGTTLAASQQVTPAATKTKVTTRHTTTTKASTTTSTAALPVTTTTVVASTTTTDAPLRLGDVATVVEDHQPLIGDAISTNGPGLLLVVDKLPGASVYQVTKGVQDALNELAPGIAGVQVDYGTYRPVTYLENGISNLVLYLVIGCALLLIALGLFFFEWRSVVVTAIVMAAGLAVAELVLRLLGFGLNWMTLAGLVLGLVAALDAVVSSVAGMRRRLAESGATEEPATCVTAVLRGARETRGAAVYTTIIVLLALLPIFSATGASGYLVRALSVAFALTVAASTAVALLVAPALAVMLFSSKGRHWEESASVRWMRRGYERAVRWMIAAPVRAYIPAIILFLAAAALVPFLGSSLVPELKDTDVLVQVNTQAGTSLTETSRVAGLMTTDLKAIPGVKEVGGDIGRAVLGDQVVNVDSSLLWVNIDGTKNYDFTLAAIQQAVARYPGVDTDVLTYANARLADAALGPKSEITVRIYGDDLDTLQSKANEASAAIQGIKGVRSTSVENLAEQPGINIEVNLAAAQRYGVEAGDVRRQAAALLSGLVVGSLYEQEKIFDVVVWGVPQVRNNLDTIRNLLIDTPSGGTVKLSDVANVSVGAQPTAISHVGASRKLDVTVNVQGRQTSEVAEDIQSRLAGISMPLDYHAEVLGSYSQLETMQLWLLILGAAAVLGMFLLFQSVLASWRLALLGLLSSLVAVSGGIVAAFVMHRTVSPTALIALVPVFGMAARYTILLARDCRQYEEQALAAEDGPEKVPVDRQGLVVQTAGAHFGRVVMIIIAAAVLLLPLAIRGDIAGLEVLHEPIVMLLSSLVTLAFVDLFVAPALYARFGYSWRKHDANV